MLGICPAFADGKSLLSCSPKSSLPMNVLLFVRLSLSPLARANMDQLEDKVLAEFVGS